MYTMHARTVYIYITIVIIYNHYYYGQLEMCQIKCRVVLGSIVGKYFNDAHAP